MNQVLTDLFGDNTVAAELAVTAVVILALVALVVLLTQRFGRGGKAGKGRAPRLAIVDALSIDNRRKLILVRRDAVEHLILIGGPADVVVEPSIQRPRTRPQPTTAREGDPALSGVVIAGSVPPISPPLAGNGAVPPAGAPPVSPPVASEAVATIPFPFSRTPPTSPPAGLGARHITPPVPGEVMPSEFAPHLGWSAPGIASLAAGGPGLDSKLNGADRSHPGDDVVMPAPSPAHTNGLRNGNGAHQVADRPAVPLVSAAARPGEDTALARVGELEVEMNRLLGQLSAERRSP